jgi:hypothetical protein
MPAWITPGGRLIDAPAQLGVGHLPAAKVDRRAIPMPGDRSIEQTGDGSLADWCIPARVRRIGRFPSKRLGGVLISKAETDAGSRQVFGAVAGSAERSTALAEPGPRC